MLPGNGKTAASTPGAAPRFSPKIEKIDPGAVSPALKSAPLLTDWPGFRNEECPFPEKVNCGPDASKRKFAPVGSFRLNANVYAFPLVSARVAVPRQLLGVLTA